MIDPQVTIAAKLAAAHHHGWAIRREDWSVPIGEDEPLHRGRLPQTADEARTASEWTSEDWMPGIEYRVGDDGMACHITSTGRLQWAVAPDGSWTVNVCRPGGRVIMVCGGADGVPTRHAVSVAYGVRHVDALATALLAIGPVAPVRSLLARLLLAVPDDDARDSYANLVRHEQARSEYEVGYTPGRSVFGALLAARAARAAVHVLPGESLASYRARRDAAATAALSAR